MNKEWSQRNKEIQVLLGKEATYKEGIQKLIPFREELFEQISNIVSSYPKGEMHMLEKTVRLLLTAGILLMIAGCIFGFIGQWIYAALVWVGAFGCCIAALIFKNQKKKEAANEKGEEDGKENE